MPALAFYVTGHGLGHASRSADVVSTLLAREPDWTLHLISDLPLDLLQQKFPLCARLRFHRRFVDGGLQQLDPLRVDGAGSALLLEQTLRRWRDCCAMEVDWLQKNQIDLVLVDVPGIPIEAAAKLGIPTIALANFGWDLIYEGFMNEGSIWEEAMACYRQAYGTCDLLLQYPWSPTMEAFPNRSPLGLVAHAGKNRREELLHELGMAEDCRLVLLGLTGWNPLPSGIREWSPRPDFCLFSCAPFNLNVQGIPCVNWTGPFRDLVASADVVLTKAGFGMFSDAARNDTPLLVLNREGFAETPFLTAGLGRNLRGLPLPEEDLSRDRLPGKVEEAYSLPPVSDMLPFDGADAIHAAIRARIPRGKKSTPPGVQR